MTNQVKDCRVLQKGQHILVELKEAISEIRDLESLCADHIDPLLHCEETLELVAIDIASVCTDGAEWPIIRKMVTEAGIGEHLADVLPTCSVCAYGGNIYGN